jgi:hypothetical protein
LPYRRLLAFASCLAVAAYFCAPPAARAAADTDAVSLLAKHRAFAGWQMGDGTFKTLRIRGKATDAKGATHFTFAELHAGLVYRTTYVDVKRGSTTEDEGFTGNVFWQSNRNGFTTPSFGDSAKLALAVDAVFNEGIGQLVPTSQGAGSVDGKPAQIVRVSLPGGYPIDLYVDPSTGAYEQVVVDPGGTQTETIVVLSYADAAPGKKYVASYKTEGDSDTWTNTAFDANPAVALEEFYPPAARATWNFANPNPFPMKVTDTRFIVDAKVNGVPGRFLIDTGAFGIFLTRKFAARANVKQFSSDRAYGIGGGTNTDVDRIDTLEIGGNTLSNVIAYAGSDSFDDDAPDGLIGFDLFGGAIVRLDSSTQHMTIQDPATASAGATAGVQLNVDLTGGTPSVPMKMDGTIAVNATLDSGNFYYVLFGKELITHYGLRMLVDDSVGGGLQSHPIVGGAGGFEVERCGHVDSLVLGPIVYQQPPACESGSFSGRDVLVGYDFLRHFDYVFDYPHGHLIMIPHKT